MKTNNLFKTVLLLLALVGGTSASWADGTVSIPQDLGSYINWSNATTTATAENTGDADGGNLGNTGNGKTASFTINNTTAQDYLLTFRSSIKEGTAVWNIKITNSSSKEVLNKDFTVANTGDFSNYTNYHEYVLKNLAADTYTLTFTASSHTQSSYCGNLKYLAFTIASSLPSTLLNSGTDVGSIYNGNSHVYYLYNSTADTYGLQMEMYRNSGNTVGATVGFTIEDIATSSSEYTGSYELASDYPTDYCKHGSGRIVMANPTMTTGFKKLTISFTSTHSSYLCNYRNVGFKALSNYDTSAGSITLENGLYYDCRWNDDSNNKVSYIASGSKIYYYVYNAAEGTFQLTMNVSSSSSSGTWTATVYDFNTQSSSSNSYSHSTTGEETISLTIKKGLNRIALTFEPSSTYLLDYDALTVTPTDLTLSDSYNYDFTSFNNKTVNATLHRSITANKWSTICLPFSMTEEQVTSTFGSGTKLATVGTYSDNTLTMTTATKISANVPCFIKVPSDFSSNTISGVTIVESTDPSRTINNDFKLVGVYQSGTIASGNFFVKDNKLYKSIGNSRIKPFRAYFTNVPSASSINLLFFDEEATGIEQMKSSRQAMENEYYDLQGRRVAQPTKGLYIVNGKKIVIK